MYPLPFQEKFQKQIKMVRPGVFMPWWVHETNQTDQLNPHLGFV